MTYHTTKPFTASGLGPAPAPQAITHGLTMAEMAALDRKRHEKAWGFSKARRFGSTADPKRPLNEREKIAKARREKVQALMGDHQAGEIATMIGSRLATVQNDIRILKGGPV